MFALTDRPMPRHLTKTAHCRSVHLASESVRLTTLGPPLVRSRFLGIVASSQELLSKLGLTSNATVV